MPRDHGRSRATLAAQRREPEVFHFAKENPCLSNHRLVHRMSAGKFSKALPRQQWWCCAGPASISSLASGGEVILRRTISRLYASGCREFCFVHFLYLDGIQSPGCSCLSWLAWEDLATDCSSTPGLRWLPQPTLQSWSMAVFPSLRFWCPASPSAIDRGRRAIASLALASIGILLIGIQSFSEENGSTGSQWLGDLFFLCAASCFASFGLLLKKWRVHPWETTVGIATVSMLVYLPSLRPVPSQRPGLGSHFADSPAVPLPGGHSRLASRSALCVRQSDNRTHESLTDAGPGARNLRPGGNPTAW
jgi:hypothetical protein